MKRVVQVLMIMLGFATSGFSANKAAFLHRFGGDLSSWEESGTMTYLQSQGIIDDFVNVPYRVKGKDTSLVEIAAKIGAIHR